MISADSLIDAATAQGFSFFTGVPCSYLSPVINRVISRSDCRYVGATSEGESVAIAAGAWLAGRDTVVMCQNSGLGNAVNPLTSLNRPFLIPTLLLVTWRGKPGEPDEPQHLLMGQKTQALLQTIEIPSIDFPSEELSVMNALSSARNHMDSANLPFAMILSRGAVSPSILKRPANPEREWIGKFEDCRTGLLDTTRQEALEVVIANLSEETAIIATTGMCGRELFTISDREQHFYQVGSMGAASAVALGVALNVESPVVVLDGDGAALMKMGNMATIGSNAPENLIHVILDNAAHDSTGGQATVSPNVDFAGVALSCGYKAAWRCDSPDGFQAALRSAIEMRGPTMVHMQIAPGSMRNLGRPTIAPSDVARRFRTFLRSLNTTHQSFQKAADI